MRTLSRFQQKFTSLQLQVEKVLSVGPPFSVVVPTMYQSSLRGVGLNSTVIGDPKKNFKKIIFRIFFRKIYKCRILRTLSRFQQKFTSLHLQVEKVLSVGIP